MRALLVRPGPHFSVEDVANGYVAGLTDLGVDVQDFALGDAMEFSEMGLQAAGGVADTSRQASMIAAQLCRGAIFDWWPDVVIVVSSFFLPPVFYESVRGKGIKLVTLFTESPYEDDAQVNIAAHATACAVNDPQNLERFREVNPNTIYLPHAYSPAVHHPRPAVDRYASDFCFVGTGYPSRIEFFEQCDFSGVDVALAGNWQELPDDSPLTKHVAHERERCITNTDAQEFYASTKASANIYRTEAQRPELSAGWAMGPREVELAASGTFFLTEARGENREVLPFVPTFEGPDDFSEKLRWWLDHDTYRAEVSDLARAAVSDRTFKSNAQKLLQLAGL